jgi:hypothetical protein
MTTIDWILKFFELFEQGRSQAILVIVVVILAWVIARLKLAALKKVDEEQDVLLRKHAEDIAAHTEDLRDLKREQSERFSRITQEIRETKMSNDASIKLLAYQLQTVESKVDDIGEALTKHTESGELFQKYIYERLGGAAK